MSDMGQILEGLQPSTPDTAVSQLAYRLADIQAVPGVVLSEPCREAYLAILPDPNGVTLNFLGLEWVGESADGSIEVRVLFHGDGTGSALRELRHTYWGPTGDGYCFYLPLEKTIALLGALRQYFDGD